MITSNFTPHFDVPWTVEGGSALDGGGNPGEAGRRGATHDGPEPAR
jgi:hypothetical protein